MVKPNGKEDFAVSALHRKRDAIVAEIGELEIATQNLIIQLGHIDAALKIMRPETTIAPTVFHRVAAHPRSKRGENMRPILVALHQASGPLMVRDIARAMLIAQGKPAQRVSQDARAVVRLVLRDLKKKGVVPPVGLDGPAQTWELVRD
jgi:hypothetical protein